MGALLCVDENVPAVEEAESVFETAGNEEMEGGGHYLDEVSLGSHVRTSM